MPLATQEGDACRASKGAEQAGPPAGRGVEWHSVRREGGLQRLGPATVVHEWGCKARSLPLQGKRLFVTGKLWPRLFRVKLEAPDATETKSLQALAARCWPRAFPL